MPENLIILKPDCDKPSAGARLDRLFSRAVSDLTAEAAAPAKAGAPHPCLPLISLLLSGETVTNAADLTRRLAAGALQNRRILFMAALDENGINAEAWAMMAAIRRSPNGLEGSVGALIIDAASEFYTKDLARLVGFSMNQTGCLLIGRPLVEGTASLDNFKIIAKNLGCGLEDAYVASLRDLLRRLLTFEAPRFAKPKLLCLHASNRETSNTLRLWNKVKENLDPAIAIEEVALRNGEIKDCIGCHFDTCMYFSRQASCFFGGSIVEEVCPALSECDAVMMLCPNYNDAIGANMAALINRLTALYRNTPFSDKYLYAIIVSGYSGGDIVAQQLIGSLNMNKAFILPPHFALMETANAPGSIEHIPHINALATEFAGEISGRLCARL